MKTLIFQIKLYYQKCEAIQNKFKSNFSKKKFEAELKKTNLEVNWDDFVITKNSDNSIAYEFSTNKKYLLSLTGEEDKKQAKNSIKKLYSFIKVHVNVAEDGELDFQILQYYGNKKDVKKVNLHNLHAYDSSVYYRDIEGKLSKIEVYKNGVVVDEVKYVSNNEDNKSKESPIERIQFLYQSISI